MPGTATRDYYELLGVSPTATEDEIRKAYLKLAKKYHPDKTGGDKAAEEKLKAINEAYDTLKNAEKRRDYDALRESPFAGARGGPGFDPRGFGGGPGGYTADFGDIFGGLGDLFGGRAQRPRRQGPVPGNDVEGRLTITLREAATGVRKSIRIPHTAACSDCGGSGAQPGTQPQTCPACDGSGRASRGTASFFISQTCPQCHGAGKVIASPCGSCAGSGVHKGSHTVTVNIPAGVDTGTRLRLAGQGDAGLRGGPPGDLYVVVTVRPDAVFEREGPDIACEIPVSFAEAALGATLRVPTLTGKADLKIPEGTQSGQSFRLRGLGLPSVHGRGRGDQIVRVTVEVPKRLTREQREIIKRLKALDDPAAYPKRREFERHMNG